MRDLVFLDQKLWRIKKWSAWFVYLPFVREVYLAGSLAMGEGESDSDWDVLMIVKRGRLFTARFFVLLFFGFVGRRTSFLRGGDGFCFNHFVAEDFWDLEFARNEYDKKILGNLKLIYGTGEWLGRFLLRNEWVGVKINDLFLESPILILGEDAWFKKRFEGACSSWLEKKLQKIQEWKMKRSLRYLGNSNSVLITNENEVRLWFRPRA